STVDPSAVTSTGVRWGEVVDPIPHCPALLSPQHHAVPSLFTAHVVSQPVVTPTTPFPSAMTCCGVAWDRAAASAVNPSAPAAFSPKPQSVLLVNTAHTWRSPTENDFTFAPSAVTCWGTRYVEPASPSPIPI